MTSTTPESADKPPLPDVLPFDDFAMGRYLDEIQRHVGRALNAARLMDKAIAMRRSLGFNVPPSPSSNAEGQRLHEKAFDHAETVVSETAMVAQLIWPKTKNGQMGPGETKPERDQRMKFAEGRGAAIREALSVPEDSPIRSRALRNSIEHFDERLDRLMMYPPRIILRNNIGSKDMITGIEGLEEMHLHHFNPEDGQYTILGESVSLPDVTRALQALDRQVVAAKERLAARHWSATRRPWDPGGPHL